VLAIFVHLFLKDERVCSPSITRSSKIESLNENALLGTGGMGKIVPEKSALGDWRLSHRRSPCDWIIFQKSSDFYQVIKVF
jgi:hypothetical protein